MTTNSILNAPENHSFSLSQITHELRNPLTLIYSTLQLIEHQHPEVKSYSQWDSLFYDVEFMVDLLAGLSSYSHGDSPSFMTIHTSAFLKHAALTFASSLSSSAIHFTSHIDPGLPDINGDSTLLKEVLFNLLKNSVDAVDPEHSNSTEGDIEMDAFMHYGKLIITIADSGCGISSEQLPYIFEPFVTFKKDGSGIGLPLVQRIVKSHEGSLDFVSTPGSGTTFRITLPIKKYGTDKTSH